MAANGSRADDVTTWLGQQKGAMLALLEQLVNIDSSSYDKAGVDAVGERFRRFFSEFGIPTTHQTNERFGDALKAHVEGSGGHNKPVVLMGHQDTVFPKARRRAGPSRSKAIGCTGRESPT